MITNKLSNLDEKEGFRILEKYLVKDKVFARLQTDCRSELKRCDLDYILNFSTDDMYITKNNTGEPKTPISRNRDKYIYAANIPKDVIFNPEYLKRLESKKTFSSIKIERYKIEKYINSLIDYDQAILLNAINPKIKLRSQKKYLKKFETIIYYKLTERTKKEHTKKALKALYDLIIQVENNLIKLEGLP